MMLKFKYSMKMSVAIVAAGFYFPIGVHANNTSHVIVGNYTANFPQSLILNSQDVGTSWQRREVIDLPKNVVDSYLDDVTCTNSTCIAVGTYNVSNINKTLPLITVSHDKGKTWQIRQVNNLPASTYVRDFNKVTCQGNFCLALGLSTEFNVNYLPLVITSEDDGENWSTVKTPIKELSKLIGDCNALTCAMTYTYYDSKNSLYNLGITVTRDQGRTWKKIEKIKDYDALQSQQLSPRNIKCSEKQCLILTNSYNLFVSNADATKWRAVTKIDNHNMREMKINRFQGSDCIGDVCIVLGQAKNKPLIIRSIDNGDNWHKVELSNDIKNLASFDSASVSCHKEVCLAAGFVIGSQNKSSIKILRSIDKGKTWLEAKNVPVYSDYFENISILTNAKVSIITFGSDSTLSHLLFSSDLGETWNEKDIRETIPSIFNLKAIARTTAD